MRKACYNIFANFTKINYLFVLATISSVVVAVLLILIAVVITASLVLYFGKKKQKKNLGESKKDP